MTVLLEYLNFLNTKYSKLQFQILYFYVRIMPNAISNLVNSSMTFMIMTKRTIINQYNILISIITNTDFSTDYWSTTLDRLEIYSNTTVTLIEQSQVVQYMWLHTCYKSN